MSSRDARVDLDADLDGSAEQTPSCIGLILDAIPRDAALECVIQGPIWALAVVRSADGRRVAGMAGVPHGLRDRCCLPARLAPGVRTVKDPEMMETTEAGRTRFDVRFDTGEEPAEPWARLLRSSEGGESAIGLAVCNALLAIEPAPASDMDGVAWLLERAADRSVAVVGHFPFADRVLRTIARDVWVIEREPTGAEYGVAESGDLLGRADIIVITGSAVANHSIDALLDAANPSAPVLVLGPSTPLLPALFGRGIDALGGVRVDAVDDVAAGLLAGRTFRQMDGLRRVTLLR